MLTMRFVSAEFPAPRPIRLRKDLIIGFVDANRIEIDMYCDINLIYKDGKSSGEQLRPITRVDTIAGKSYYVFGDIDELAEEFELET